MGNDPHDQRGCEHQATDTAAASGHSKSKRAPARKLRAGRLNERFGSEAVVHPDLPNVRFAPKADIHLQPMFGPWSEGYSGGLRPNKARH